MGVRAGFGLAVSALAALMLLIGIALAPARAASIEDLLQAESSKVDVLIAQENFKAALEPARRLMAKARKLLKPGDPRLTIFAVQLADLHSRAGNTAKAVATALAAAKLTARSDSDSALLIDSLNRLARILAKNRKFDAAVQVLTKAVALAENTKGPDSAEVAQLQRSLVDVYNQQGRKAEAKACNSGSMRPSWRRSRVMGTHSFRSFNEI